MESIKNTSSARLARGSHHLLFFYFSDRPVRRKGKLMKISTTQCGKSLCALLSSYCRKMSWISFISDESLSGVNQIRLLFHDLHASVITEALQDPCVKLHEKVVERERVRGASWINCRHRLARCELYSLE